MRIIQYGTTHNYSVLHPWYAKHKQRLSHVVSRENTASPIVALVVALLASHVALVVTLLASHHARATHSILHAAAHALQQQGPAEGVQQLQTSGSAQHWRVSGSPHPLQLEENSAATAESGHHKGHSASGASSKPGCFCVNCRWKAACAEQQRGSQPGGSECTLKAHAGKAGP